MSDTSNVKLLLEKGFSIKCVDAYYTCYECNAILELSHKDYQNIYIKYSISDYKDLNFIKTQVNELLTNSFDIYLVDTIYAELEDFKLNDIKKAFENESESFDFEKTEQMIESENLAKTIILTQLV